MYRLKTQLHNTVMKFSSCLCTLRIPLGHAFFFFFFKCFSQFVYRTWQITLLMLLKTLSTREVRDIFILIMMSWASTGLSGMQPFTVIILFPSLSACHILECPQGRASEVINSIGQAFETRFRQLLSHTSSLHSTNPRSAFCLFILLV